MSKMLDRMRDYYGFSDAHFEYIKRLRREGRKEAVLSRLQKASWMKDAGWSDAQIAEHNARDRSHRARVIWERRRSKAQPL